MSISDKSFSTPEAFNDYLRNSQASIVYFYSNSCTPCMQLRPKVSELVEANYPDLDLILVDAAAYPLLTSAFGAFTFPTLILLFEGKEFRRYSKYVSMAELKQDIDRLSALYFDS